ncbi:MULTISPECIES: potassium transporter TrkA [Haloarcula]|uniref:potassium transporter TrkA n=1 Tax=Haloarcula TaxID=2237 RepID=UPI0023ECFF3A|nr:potassium transporter TrkA [Halomicroarcula sp. XH51]
MTGPVILQSGGATAMLLQEGAELLGLGIAVATVSGLVALLYRWYVREHVPNGLAVLFGLTVVALYLGTTTALGQVIGGEEGVLQLRAVLPNLAAFAVGGVASYAGLKIGDRLGTDLFVTAGGRQVEADVSEIVQTVGRVTSVKLPEEIDDIVGYDPMPEATKETLENRRFLFPRRLTRDELRSRLVSRLKADYGVGHVDVELDDGGTVTYLAIGSRAAGIGPTLPPSTNAVAIRADPANAASAGDLVQVWGTDPPRRLLTGELRGVAGETVTVAIDAAETPKVDQTERYRLVTLPVEDRPDREFASLLRAADETMGTVTVGPGSALDGATVDSVDATVVAITQDGTTPRTIPASGESLSAGDVLYLIAKPAALRSIETAAEGTATDAGVDAPPEVSPATDPGGDGDLPDGADDGGKQTGGTEPADDDTPTDPTDGATPDASVAADVATGAAADAETADDTGGTVPPDADAGDAPATERDAGDVPATELEIGDVDGAGAREPTDGDGPESADTDDDREPADGGPDASDESTPGPDDGHAGGEDSTDPPTEEGGVVGADEDVAPGADGDDDTDPLEDDGFGSLTDEAGDEAVDIDDFLTSSADVEVWDPEDRLPSDDEERDAADTDAAGGKETGGAADETPENGVADEQADGEDEEEDAADDATDTGER